MKLEKNESLVVGSVYETKKEWKARQKKGLPMPTYSYIAVKSESKTKRRRNNNLPHNR